jgi:hypothetical protein
MRNAIARRYLFALASCLAISSFSQSEGNLAVKKSVSGLGGSGSAYSNQVTVGEPLPGGGVLTVEFRATGDMRVPNSVIR